MLVNACDHTACSTRNCRHGACVWLLSCLGQILVITDHLTYLLKNLYVGQETTVRTGYGTNGSIWFKFVKEVQQGCVLSPCLFNLYTEYIMWNAGLYESQAGIKIAGRNINNLRVCRWYSFNCRKLGWKSWLKTQHYKNLRSWHPVPSVHGKQKGKKQKQWQILFSWAPKSLLMVTAAMKLKDACFLEGKLWQS